jgi:insulysin
LKFRLPKLSHLMPLFALALAACAQPSLSPIDNSAEPKPDAYAAVNIRKSPNDTRAYRYLELPNKLRIVLVSDPATEKAAAALSVYRGSFHEPEDRPGLAHFLEHMLFIQTEAYPEIDGFQHYISANGGSSNAYTALDHTNYFFDVAPDAFDEALDRFAHFFINPVISPEYSAREKNAVHSEYQMQIKDDGWRGYMVGKQALNPAHPGSKFTIGSLDTLAGDIHEDLVDFFETQYSADQMGLVVIADQSLEALEARIRPLFSKIKNKNIGPDYPDMPMYTDKQVPAQLEIQSLKDGARVSYLFPLPNARIHYRNKPEQYFTNLIGHEGKGSLYQHLNALGWIESLSASVGDLDRNSSALSISIELTPVGRNKIPEISSYLFQYIDLIKKTPPQRWLYEEQAKVAELGFRFQEKSRPTSLVYQLAPRLDEYPPEDLLVAPYLMEEFDQRTIEDFLSHITPANVLVEIVAPDIEGSLTEPWFNVPYNLNRQPLQRRAVAQADFVLPKANPFLPDDLHLKSGDDQDIARFIQAPGLELWLDKDVSFGSPRANLYLQLAIDGGFVTPADRSKAQLYRMMVEDSLSEITYPAYLAGLGYSLSVPDAGFELRIGGYHDKQKELLDTVLSALFNAELRPERFTALKSSLIKDWRNAAKDRPYSQAFAALPDTLREGQWPRPMLVAALRNVSLDELQAWRDQKLARVGVRGMIHGNVAAADLKTLQKLLQRKLPLADNNFIQPTVRTIHGPLRLEVPVDHNDAAMVLHVQDPDESFESRARSSLAAQFLQPAYFLQLRTEQQLGYVVSVTNRPVAKRGGISFIVQSPNTSSAELEQATLAFVDDYVNAWPEVTEAEFEQQKAGLINRLLQSPKNLNERSMRYWADLSDEHYSFDSREQVAAIVASLTKEDMGQFLARLQQKLVADRLLIYTKGQFDAVPQTGQLLSNATQSWDDGPAG